jgi:predicted DNA-binding WGR domain protein
MTTKVLVVKPTGTVEPMLGRYEYHDDKSHKFYEAVYDTKTDEFCVLWGRIGAMPQINRGLSDKQVVNKIIQKSGKGYRFVGDAVSCHKLGDGFITKAVSEHSRHEQSYARMSNDEQFDFEEELQRL